MSRRTVYYSTGPSWLYAGRFTMTSDVALDTSDYWTLRLYRVRSGQTTGEWVGSLFSFATRDLNAHKRGILFNDKAGLALVDGESIVLVGTENGSPAALDGVVVHLDVERRPS